MDGLLGVWGLDDYHCLIYVWGASQLLNHPDICPGDIHDVMLVLSGGAEYMYLEGIQTIQRIKNTAPFYETSPMLHSISQLGDWKAVKNGMHKLYLGEVRRAQICSRHSADNTCVRVCLSLSLYLSLPVTHHMPTMPGAEQAACGAAHGLWTPLPRLLDALRAGLPSGGRSWRGSTP
jgi:hypothetical protein